MRVQKAEKPAAADTANGLRGDCRLCGLNVPHATPAPAENQDGRTLKVARRRVVAWRGVQI